MLPELTRYISSFLQEPRYTVFAYVDNKILVWYQNYDMEGTWNNKPSEVLEHKNNDYIVHEIDVYKDKIVAGYECFDEHSRENVDEIIVWKKCEGSYKIMQSFTAPSFNVQFNKFNPNIILTSRSELNAYELSDYQIKKLETFNLHETNLSFSKNSEFVATYDGVSGIVKVYDHEYKLVSQITSEHKIYDICVSNNGEIVVLSYFFNKGVTIYYKQKKLNIVQTNIGAIDSCYILNNNKTIILCSVNKVCVCEINVADEKMTLLQEVHINKYSNIETMELSCDEKMGVIFCSDDKHTDIFVWKMMKNKIKLVKRLPMDVMGGKIKKEQKFWSPKLEELNDFT